MYGFENICRLQLQSARLIYTSPKVKPWGFVNGKIAKPLRHPQNARVGFFAGIEDQNIIP